MEIWEILLTTAGLVLIIIAVFGWAVHRGQFEELDAEAERILTDETPALDARQGRTSAHAEKS